MGAGAIDPIGHKPRVREGLLGDVRKGKKGVSGAMI
jgi:hypothetical protein